MLVQRIAIIAIAGECHRLDDSATNFNTTVGNSNAPLQLPERECHRLQNDDSATIFMKSRYVAIFRECHRQTMLS